MGGRALVVLRVLVDTDEWNEHNYLMQAATPSSPDRGGDGSLRANAYIARTPGQNSSDAIFVTALEGKSLRQGIATVRAVRRVEHSLHASMQRVRRQFLRGECEQAVFAAMQAVEVRGRKLCGFPDHKVGIAHAARLPSRPPLTDPDAVSSEPVETMNLVAGAAAVLRNTAGHRDVDYDDVIGGCRGRRRHQFADADPSRVERLLTT